MRMKEKICGKDEIKSIFLRGYVWHVCFYKLLLLLNSFSHNQPCHFSQCALWYLCVSILIICASLFFFLSSLSCMSVPKKLQKQTFSSVCSGRGYTQRMEREYCGLIKPSSFKGPREEGISRKQEQSEVGRPSFISLIY